MAWGRVVDQAWEDGKVGEGVGLRVFAATSCERTGSAGHGRDEGGSHNHLVGKGFGIQDIRVLLDSLDEGLDLE